MRKLRKPSRTFRMAMIGGKLGDCRATMDIEGRSEKQARTMMLGVAYRNAKWFRAGDQQVEAPDEGTIQIVSVTES